MNHPAFLICNTMLTCAIAQLYMLFKLELGNHQAGFELILSKGLDSKLFF
jgi:hypothetical protein